MEINNPYTMIFKEQLKRSDEGWCETGLLWKHGHDILPTNLEVSEDLENPAPVAQRPDNFIRWIRHYSRSKIYLTLNVVQGFRALPNLINCG